MKRFLFLLFFITGAMGIEFAQQPTPATPQARTVAEQSPSAERIWTDLMKGNQRFISGKVNTVEIVSLRHNVSAKQSPKVVVLTCSDSRVSPELLFDKSLGDLFVVRSAGNVADAIGVGSIEYAVENLGSIVLVVLGHTECGAVKAACSGDKMPTANLQAIMDKIMPAVTRAKTHANADELTEAAIQENVRQSANDVIASSEVLQHSVHDGKLTVFEAVYDLSSGKVVPLKPVPSRDRH
jgi:carbonic anhydrase